MTLANIKNMKKERGFTIVELLIVIVVIAILAAIVIVAYNGVQNKAKTSSAQAAAQAVRSKSEAYNADQGKYPSFLGDMTKAASSETYSLSGVTFLANDPSSTSVPSDTASVSFYTCTLGGNLVGNKVVYWDYSAGNAVSLYSGSASSSGVTCTKTTTEENPS